MDDEPSFPLMKLPPEIRLEIYRACLTRPWNITMSRKPVKKPREELRPADVVDVHSHHHVEASSHRSSSSSSSPPPSSSDRIRTLAVPPRRRRRRRPSPRYRDSSSDDADGSGTSGSQSSSSGSSSSTSTSTTVSYTIVASLPATSTTKTKPAPSTDPLITNLLLVSREVRSEARAVLYGDNKFTLDLATAAVTLSSLHQHTRRLIRHVEIEIPGFTDICEPFGNAVRLGLRYCSSLRTLVMHIPFSLPSAATKGARTPQTGVASTVPASSEQSPAPPPASNSTITAKSSLSAASQISVYTHGFDTLRWLPQGCDIVLQGKPNPEILDAVREHLAFARTLDKVAYARRQIMSFESHSTIAAGTRPHLPVYREGVNE